MSQMLVPKINAAPLDNAENNNRLLDTVMSTTGLKNDAALARAIEVAPPVVSKIRHGALPIGATNLTRLHEISGLSIADLKFIGQRAA